MFLRWFSSSDHWNFSNYNTFFNLWSPIIIRRKNIVKIGGFLGSCASYQWCKTPGLTHPSDTRTCSPKRPKIQRRETLKAISIYLFSIKNPKKDFGYRLRPRRCLFLHLSFSPLLSFLSLLLFLSWYILHWGGNGNQAMVCTIHKRMRKKNQKKQFKKKKENNIKMERICSRKWIVLPPWVMNDT